MPENILVIKLSALGDFLVAVSSMQAIRQHHPDANITLLTTKPFVELAKRSGIFNHVVVDSRPRLGQLTKWLAVREILNSGNYSRVYDLQLNTRTKIYYRLFKNRPEWVGVITGASHCFSKKDWRNMHAYERHVAMLGEAGIVVRPPDLSWMRNDDFAAMPDGRFVILIPGCAPSHPEKRWPSSRYASLAQTLERQGIRSVVVGTAADKEAIDDIVKICPGVIDLCGKTTLFDLYTLASRALGAVGNDTGPTHLIAMAGCPTVAVFSGTTSPDLSRPVGDKVEVVQSGDLAALQPQDVMLRLSKISNL
ncbi:MAG: glycosyltransferase family 9 protein [bacterium]|nr:glycosyltransferase family 9 protein [bacterium]